MRHLNIILALVVASQVVGIGQLRTLCESSGCSMCIEHGAPCSGCAESPAGCRCGTAPKNDAPPKPAPAESTEEAVRTLLVATERSLHCSMPAVADDSLPHPATAERAAPPLELTHNERLALHCICRT